MVSGEDQPVLEARLVSKAAQPPAPENPCFTSAGELRSHEIIFRLGLLLAAALFLAEGQGVPWTRHPLVISGAFAMSALIVTTMALQWRVLGDWRRATQRFVLLALILVLVVPISAVISPELSNMALPETLKALIGDAHELSQSIPGIAVTIKLVHSLFIFFFFVVVMTVLIATSGPNSRVGFGLIAIALAAAGLFLYPSAETIVGMVLLAFLFRIQWEKPLLVPDDMRARLSPSQIKFLRLLVRHGSLGTGETKLYLDNNATVFAELVEYRLAEYDTIAREVIPGRRLLHDPACETLEKTLGIARRAVWFILGLTYLLMPDLVPGPIDDFIVMFLCSGAGLNWFNALFPRRQR